MPGPTAAKPRAAAGALIAPAEAAAHVVVGAIGLVRKLDAQGYGAELAVDRALIGGAQPGARLRIAWEELAPSRGVRFAQGELVLVALEPLPNGSLWMQRFPRRDAWAVAGRGEAFSRELSAAGTEALASYLRLPSPERARPAGVTALAEIARVGEAPLALEALALLGARPALAAQLTPRARATLAALLLDAQRGDSVRAAALELSARRKLRALVPELRKLAAAAGALRPLAVEALGAMGSLSPDEVRAFAASPEPAVRAAIVRGAPVAFEASRLAALAQNDAAGSVRAAALEGLARREGARAAGVTVDALFDDDPNVQAAALLALRAFPAEAAPLLRARVFGQLADDPAAARTALAGLGVLGRDGAAVLREIAREHANDEIRELAQFLLGRTPEH